MIYAFFSDLHSKLPVLDSLVKHHQFASADKRIYLGDAFNIHEVISAKDSYKQVSSLADVMVLGNHEAMVTGECDETVFSNKTIANRMLTSRDELLKDDEFLSELKTLPIEYSESDFAATHASFNPDDRWAHVRYIEDLKTQEPYLKNRLNIVAHGHIPFVAWKQDSLWYYQRMVYSKPFCLKNGTTYLVSTGSLLGSRELRQYERTFMVYDDAKSELEFINIGEQL